jgi:alkyl hydroperoxide reductase subunit AhpF
MDQPDFDCLVVVGGPAGLTAAIYLTRRYLSARPARLTPSGPGNISG